MIACLSVLENSFHEAREFFNGIIAKLSSNDLKKLQLHQVEELLSADTQELGRLILQAHIDNLGPGDVSEYIIREDGKELTHRRLSDRTLTTVFGEVEVNRLGYGNRGENSIYPLDQGMGLPDIKKSYCVQYNVVREAVRETFDEAVSTVQHYTAAKVCKSQAQEIVEKASEDFYGYYRELSELGPSPEESSEILVLSVDGKGIPMKKEDLTPKTREAAEKTEEIERKRRRGKKSTKKRLKKGEKRNKKRMATVAAVYTVAPFVRVTCDIMGEFSGEDNISKVKRPKPEGKRVWASIESSKADVFDDLYDEALRRCGNNDKKIVFLSDGEKKHQMLAKKKLSKLGNVIIIHDIVHTIEYLWKATYAFNREGSLEAEEWVSERLLKILQGDVSQVAAGIRRSATLQRLSKIQRKPVDKAANYLLNHKKYMKYNEYLSNGFPIASGVIEATCKNLISDRFEKTGARWSLEGAEALLKMSALYLSGDEKNYWNYHIKKEQKRIWMQKKWSSPGCEKQDLYGAHIDEAVSF